MRWAEISVEAFAASADAVTDVLIDAGCAGASVEPAAGSDSLVVKGYLPVDDKLEESLQRVEARVRRLPELGLKLPSDEVAVGWVDDEEWAAAWKKFFKPIKMGRIVIKPSWEEFEARDGEIVVEIDPGMAFGTGGHASTKLCLLALQEHIRGGETVLDVGTGSGILALAAAKLGASRVLGLDNDPVAVKVARENVHRAGLQEKLAVELGDSPLAFEGVANVVVANIVPNVIIPMADALSAKAMPGGMVITSGIILERAAEVRTALEKAGLLTYQQLIDGEWVALVSVRAKRLHADVARRTGSCEANASPLHRTHRHADETEP